MKALDEAVRFTALCTEFKMEPREFATLIGLSRRAFAAAERECNVKNYSGAKGAREQVEVHAKSMGLRTEWNGLGPTFYRGERQSMGGRALDCLPFLD